MILKSNKNTSYITIFYKQTTKFGHFTCMTLSLSFCYSFRLKREQHHLFAALCTVEPSKPKQTPPFFKTKPFGSHYG
jgi:hypothetical protein